MHGKKLVNDKQLTVIWHIDYLKVSHVDEKVVTEFIDWLKSKYEDKEIGVMAAKHGKKHEYLGMDLDYINPGEIKLSMVE